MKNPRSSAKAFGSSSTGPSRRGGRPREGLPGGGGGRGGGGPNGGGGNTPAKGPASPALATRRTFMVSSGRRRSACQAARESRIGTCAPLWPSISKRAEAIFSPSLTSFATPAQGAALLQYSVGSTWRLLLT